MKVCGDRLHDLEPGISRVFYLESKRVQCNGIGRRVFDQCADDGRFWRLVYQAVDVILLDAITDLAQVLQAAAGLFIKADRTGVVESVLVFEVLEGVVVGDVRLIRAFERCCQQCSDFIDSINDYTSAGTPEGQGRKKIYWVGGAIVVVGIACTLLIIRGMEKPPKIVYEKGHDAARILIQGAMEKAIIICRELTEIEIKRKNVKIAQDLGDSALVDSYNRHIREKEQNIRDGVSTYAGFIKQLADMEDHVVNEAFDSFTQSLIHEGKIKKVKFTKQVKSAYQSYSTDQQLVDRSTMQTACTSH